MTSVIAHRGPDGVGYYHDAHAHLGHRRLSIIDLAGGGQPMTNEDGSLQIIYNGEIFNHASVRPDLEAAGHRYQSRCDTETIVHAYEQWGPAGVERFRGMFAFAIWDKRSRTLFAARDRLGIKPFYYFWDGRVFAFASEIKALLEHPAITAAFDETTLPEYLAFGYLSSDRTMFRNVRQLLPGHHLTLRLGEAQPEPAIRQYWEVPGEPESYLPDEELLADTRRRLEETVRMRLMSDVPLGMFLSGGVDSSAIAALMSRMVDGKVKTFAVGYQEAEYSELSYARHVAGHIGTEHHEVTVSAEQFFNALPRLVWHEDEPITWPSSVSLYFVSQLAAREVKVVLTGEGSDEMFGGYARYRSYVADLKRLETYVKVPAGMRRGIKRFIETSSLLPVDLRRKLGHTILGRGQCMNSLYVDNFYSAFSRDEQKSLLREAAAASPYAAYRGYFDNAPGRRSTLSRLLYGDQKTYLVELLRKQDRMSMAVSIESRVPFLDHTFVEFSTRIPDHLRIQGPEQKYILKRAVEDLLPREIIYRKKMGFPTPLRSWLRGEPGKAVFSLLRDPRGLLAGCIDASALDRLIDRQLSGFEDNTDRLWRLLTLQLWGDMYLTGRREQRWEGFIETSSARARASVA